MHGDACRCMEMHVDASMELHGDARRRKVDWKIVAFLSSVVYYFGDLLKSANITFYGTKRSLVYILIVYHHYRSF